VTFGLDRMVIRFYLSILDTRSIIYYEGRVVMAIHIFDILDKYSLRDFAMDSDGG